MNLRRPTVFPVAPRHHMFGLAVPRSWAARGRAMRRLASLLLALATAPLSAQIPAAEYVARRDSLAARVGNGVVLAFGGRTPITDMGPFYQLQAFHYLTNFHEPDAAFVMVVRAGRGASTLFLTPVGARRAFYYGRRPDSAAVVRTLGMSARSFAALGAVVDSLVATGLPLYELADFADADFAAEDSLTRGRAFTRALAARNPRLEVGTRTRSSIALLRERAPPSWRWLAAPRDHVGDTAPR